MQNSSEKKRCLRRLADSNIWIAFRRIGRLDLLLSVPGIAIAKCVVRELRLGTDDLAERIERSLGDDCFSVEIGGDETTDTLADVLKEKDERLPDHVRGKRLSDGDALQVAYAKTNSATTILYMRDGRAERQARGIRRSRQATRAAC